MYQEISDSSNQSIPNQQVSQLSEEQPQEKKGVPKSLTLIKVGVFEIFFVSIILILFFGIMNYFNILPISQLWPKQLGWLPHRPYAQSQQFNNLTMKQSNNVTIVSVSTTQAKQALVDFLPTIINSSFLPQSPSYVAIFQDKKIKDSFNAVLNTREATGAATLIVSPDGNRISQIVVSLPYKTLTPPSIDLAQSTLYQYFSIEPKGSWGCKALSNSLTYCENFWEEKTGIKRGIGIQGSSKPTQNRMTSAIFFCEHTKDSKLYSWKSCANEFAETGVQ